MYAARNREATEQWITPPEPALGRYLLRSGRRAANDNQSRTGKAFPILQGAACLTLSGILMLLVDLIK